MLTDGKARHLVDLDLTYRYIPLSQASYRGLVWGTEVLYNRESFERRHPTTDPIFSGENAFGLYSYVEPRI